jgi:hypothetical protein
MSTHRQVKDALDKTVHYHRVAHHDHLKQAGLQEQAENIQPAPVPPEAVLAPPLGDDG